jgi:hypothetical protein
MNIDNAAIGTIHSIAHQFVSRYWYLLGISANVSIMDTEGSKFCISQSLASLPTEADLLVFDTMCRAFNLTVPQTSQLDFGFWKRDLKNLIDKTVELCVDEKQLEEALVSNITRFLLELGQGFSFVGRQMELQMPGGQTFYPDLIFYHIPQHRYVVVELKAVKYIPEFAGKLNFYVTAVDQLMKGEGDNPTVGLVICKSTDKTVVEWSLKDICKPLGVATYQLEEVVERTIREIEMGNQSNHQ